MIAVRTTWQVKRHCMAKALELLTSNPAELGGRTVRIYTPKYSPNLLVFEMTSESTIEHDQWWAEYNARPQAAAIYEKWNELIERRVGEEVWNVAEFR